jgi:hypothetical protein
MAWLMFTDTLCSGSQNAGNDTIASNVEVKTEPTESDHLTQEVKEELADSMVESGMEEGISDEEVGPQSTQKPSPPSGSLFTIAKGKDQVLTVCDVYEDMDMR